MAIRVALTHTSRYRYDREVTLQPHVVRLRPAPHGRTPILAYSMRVTPVEHFLNWQQDPFGNYQARLVFNKPVRELTVEVDLLVEMIALNPFDFFVEEYAENYGFRYEASLARELAPYSIQSAPEARFGALIEEVHSKYARPGRRNIDVLVDINRDISQRLRYDLRMEPGVFEPEETLVRGHGSCRDFAWLEVELLRRLGYAARFVSGYSIQLKPDVKPLDGGPAGVAEDIADLHAWVEVYLPGAGWIGLDATSGLLAGEGHIPLAATAWPTTAAAISGSFTFNAKKEDDKVEETATFAMRVQRVVETARVTKPYRDDQWAAINALGARVDQDLQRYDVRLTMGGEPTFVSIDDRDAPEWNIAALGDGKRRLADKLARRLRARFAPGGLMHHGQGKWYPGEPLPRWAYAIYFRRDGEPVWTDPTLFALEPEPSRPTSPSDRLAAQGFVTALANRLGLSEELPQAAYEDAFYYLWRERRLPVNVNVLESKLEDPIERARLARVFGAGLGEVAGYILPLRPRTFDDLVLWESGRWSMREGHLFLLPGDSPMGYRLPLDGLPWESEGERMEIHARDPLAARPPLGSMVRRGPGPKPAKPAADKPKEPLPSNVVRTALCVESREGMLHVFMPPVELLEEYLALVAAVEDVARERRQPVRIEGYHPPTDYRLDRLSVTPDPGVIEVNVHPTRSWSDLTEMTEALYEEARLCRLGTEKFMLDGRHTGTGGGNHIVLGGATPSDSPFLRRPDLLRSLVGYFVNHPSLSYLFSGMFVGPTSQAPRLDEARQDSVHELELAFGEIRRQGAATPTPPWLVDRIFRHLLVDVTGNTHRTEILHRQALQPRQRDRPPGARRAPGVRDAASRADEPHPAAPAPLDGRLVLARPLPAESGTLGDRPRRSLLTPPLRATGLRGRARRPARRRLPVRDRLVPRPPRLSLPARRRDRRRRRDPGFAAGDRALACARRRAGRRRHRPLRRLVGRAPGGHDARVD